MYYTFDFTELTPEEQAEAERLSRQYFEYINELTIKLREAMDAGEDPNELNAQLSDLMVNDPSRKYLEQAEKRHFALFNGDLVAIYNDALERLPRLIIRDVNGILKRPEAEKGINETLLKPEAIRGRICYHLTMHLEALQADAVLFGKLTAEIERQTKNADKLACDRGQIPGQLSLFDASEPKRPKTKGYKNAERLGALTSINNRLYMISSEHYQHALTSYPNEYAYMVDADPDLMDAIISESIEADAGLLTISEETGGRLVENMGTKPIDTSLLEAFMTAARLCSENDNENDPYVRVYLPKFCQELGVRLNKLDPETARKMGVDFNEAGGASDGSETIVEDSHKNSNDFWTRFNAIRSYIGILNQTNYIRVVNIVGIDIKSKILSLDFPYFRQLQKEIASDPETYIPQKNNQQKRIEHKNEKRIDLKHSNITSERNQVAVSIVNEILAAIFQRGSKPDPKLPQNVNKNFRKTAKKTVTTSIKCAEIVNHIPDFKYRLENMKSNATEREKMEKNILNQQNLALKNAFSRAYTLLEEKTDAYIYFTHLEITPVIPTMRTLKDKKITITHQGVNPDFEPGDTEANKKQKKKAERIKKALNTGK